MMTDIFISRELCNLTRLTDLKWGTGASNAKTRQAFKMRNHAKLGPRSGALETMNSRLFPLLQLLFRNSHDDTSLLNDIYKSALNSRQFVKDML